MTIKKIKNTFYQFVVMLCGLPLLSIAQMGNMHMAVSSKPMRPLTEKSNESTREQLASARAEGDSIQKSITWLLDQSSTVSGQTKAGEYNFVYSIGAPEGWYEFNNSAVTWKQPVDANAHLFLFVLDGADGRVVPPLQITATIRDTTGKLILSRELPFAWIPLISGYGGNIKLPSNGSYLLTVEVLPPLYRRHDPYNGDRFTETTTAILPFTITDLSKLPVLSESMEKTPQLPKGAGTGYKNTMLTMFKQANDGRDTTSGDLNIAYALEYSEGYWFMKKGRLVYKSDNELSGDHNAHLEVVVRDRYTGRFIHDLNVKVGVFDKQRNLIDWKAEMFMWHPWLYHYGENWRVPRAGAYTVRMHIDPPAYRRYGKKTGNFFTKPLDIEFNSINIKTGQK